MGWRRLSLWEQFRQGSCRLFSTKLDARQETLMRKSLPKRIPIDGVQDVIVVSSGKGGVGKSTISVNLACQLATLGKRVGILDTDVFGPSIPMLMNIKEQPIVNDRNFMIPPINWNVKCMSMGLIANEGPIVWRGPLVMSAIQKMVRGTDWKPVDILIVDTPPGTGDVHLSLAQLINITGVVVVSTPQMAALTVTKRGVEMYRKMNVPIIGIVENMKSTICPNCHTSIDLFQGQTDEYAKELNIPFLGSVPIQPIIAKCGDAGTPIVLSQPDAVISTIFKSIANNVIAHINEAQKNRIDK